LVTVYSSLNVVDADLVNSRLDAAQFHPVIINDLSPLSRFGYTLSTGGILVQVPEDEAVAAREFPASPDATPPA
jgi:hypothetical protein